MLITLINDLLDLAKLETMNFKFNEDYFDLNQIIDNALSTMKYQASLKNIKINKDFQFRITDRRNKYYMADTSPEERRDFFKHLMGDQLRYTQILLNFISNAIKFTYNNQSINVRVVLLDSQDIQDDKSEDQSDIGNQRFYEGSEKGQDKSRVEEEISYIRFAIEIEDSGVGISEENLNDIFVDFMKVNEHNDINPNGTGLGLSICKMIVEKMRGEIKVESKVGVGTTFSVIIRTRVMLQGEPRFVNKFKFHRSDSPARRSSSHSERESEDIQDIQIRRGLSYQLLDNENFLGNNSQGAVASSINSRKIKLLIANDEPFQVLMM